MCEEGVRVSAAGAQSRSVSASEAVLWGVGCVSVLHLCVNALVQAVTLCTGLALVRGPRKAVSVLDMGGCAAQASASQRL